MSDDDFPSKWEKTYTRGGVHGDQASMAAQEVYNASNDEGKLSFLRQGSAELSHEGWHEWCVSLDPKHIKISGLQVFYKNREVGDIDKPITWELPTGGDDSRLWAITEGQVIANPEVIISLPEPYAGSDEHYAAATKLSDSGRHQEAMNELLRAQYQRTQEIEQQRLFEKNNYQQ